MTPDQIRLETVSKLSFLESKGFVRSSSLEETTSTVVSVVYMGKYVAFEFSFDFRDQCLDSEVIKVEQGKLVREWDGGYFSGIYSHLVEKECYRGSPSGGVTHAETGEHLTRMLNGVVGLLNIAGKNLLDDVPNSLALLGSTSFD